MFDILDIFFEKFFFGENESVWFKFFKILIGIIISLPLTAVLLILCLIGFRTCYECNKIIFPFQKRYGKEWFTSMCGADMGGSGTNYYCSEDCRDGKK